MRAHTQEALELRNLLQKEANVMRLEDMSARAQRAIPLGFSQVLFAAKWALREPMARGALLAFLEASDQGWRQALADPRAAAAMVVEDRAELGSLTGTEVDSAAFQEEALRRCLPYVMSSPSLPYVPDAMSAPPKKFGTEKIGTIEVEKWESAADAMALTGFSPDLVSASLSLDSTLWPAPRPTEGDGSKRHHLITEGLRVSDEMRADAKIRARAFEMRVGRKPSLAIVTVGLGHPNGPVRKKLFANDLRSWFNKEGARERACACVYECLASTKPPLIAGTRLCRDCDMAFEARDCDMALDCARVSCDMALGCA
jgi:hypothetical protein